MTQRPLVDFRIGATGHSGPTECPPVRHFIGLHPDVSRREIQGVLVRVWGYGLHAIPDVVATARHSGRRVAAALAPWPSATDPYVTALTASAELAELASEVIAPLVARLGPDASSLRAAGLLEFGQWWHDPLGRWEFLPTLDTTLLAKLTGLSLVDDFPARDLAHGGRGGPCVAAGGWLMVADRSITPGRVIRALVDVSDSAHVYLLPPRQTIQLPAAVRSDTVAPACALLDAIAQMLMDQAGFDPNEQLAIQGRRLPELAAAWDELTPQRFVWSPPGIDVAPYVQVLREWRTSLRSQAVDVLCTAIHWLSDRIVRCVRDDMPVSQPVGQVVLAGRGRGHSFLTMQLQRQLPGLQVLRSDDLGLTTSTWQATAAALLAQLHVDQIPGNTYTLTGTETPRVLGRLTPGAPSNWHAVLEDMARTLPEKITLRSAI